MDVTDITFLSLYSRSNFRVIYYHGVILIFQQMNKVFVSFPLPLPSISYFLSFWTFYLFLFIFYFFGLLMTETKTISNHSFWKSIFASLIPLFKLPLGLPLGLVFWRRVSEDILVSNSVVQEDIHGVLCGHEIL